ncbi:MAG: SAP domain-containing protein [Legionellaceae bacterium]|nr:SAP domain-containing protein [Legionellaceae bacterium]
MLINNQDAQAIKHYISQHGFGATNIPLTRLLSADVFRQHYYDKQALIKFCREVGISTVGLKQDLNDRIELFLQTGQMVQTKHNRKNHGKPDSDLGLSLDRYVVNYKSDLITRAFFQEHIPEFTGFSAYVQKWLKAKLADGERLTYADVIEKHKAYLLEKKQHKSRGEATTVAHESCQYNQFNIDYAHDGEPKIHSAQEAWLLVRNSAGEKTYQRYKHKINEIRTLLAS